MTIRRRAHARAYPLLLLGLLACSMPPPEAESTGFIVDGLQVIFRNTPGNPTVAAGFYLKGGPNYMGPNLAGIEPLLFEAATRGTETRTKDEINARLESLGTTFKVVAAYDYTGLTAQFTLDHFDLSWDLFTDVLLHPRLESGELELVRQQVITGIEKENDDPKQQVWRVANDLYYDGHPYGGSLTQLAHPACKEKYNSFRIIEHFINKIGKE